MFVAACVQLRCTDDQPANLDRAEALVRRAASYGASLIATPENTPYLGPQFHKVELAEDLDGATATRLGALAGELGVHLLVGSLGERAQGETRRCHNTSVLYGPDGARVAAYRKMHLFDVDIPGALTIAESDSIVPGTEVVVAPTPLGRLGMTICYDLRFPEMYRALRDGGAQIIAVPSAFTATTGKAHWHALLRARAIETQCYVLAPAQWGVHDPEGRRHSYGHSLIIDPWGAVIAECSDGEGICLAEIDLQKVARVRRSIPVSDHRRL